jgi:hypothetical protein
MKLSRKLFKSNLVSYKYTRKYNCPTLNTKPCIEKSCYCSYIDEFFVINVDFNKIIEKIFENFYTKSTFTERLLKLKFLIGNNTKATEYYIIDRLCSFYKIWNIESYIPNIYKGYYGEEVDGVFLKKEIADKIEDEFNKISKFDKLEDKIYYLLNLEYGYILPILKNKKITIEKIYKGQININNIEYLENEKNSIFYKPHGISGILFKNCNNNFILIDGYHRYLNDNSKKTLYIVFNE